MGRAPGEWTQLLTDQLDWHWRTQLRPRLDGLTDAEYAWEPVEGCWGLRPRAETATNLDAGAGDLVLEFAYPDPTPAPVTTIAWRLGHLAIGCFGSRAARHFGGDGSDEVNFWTTDWPATAAGGVALLDEHYDRWMIGLRGLDAEGWARPIGAAEGPRGDSPMAALALHLNREAIHHGAEIALLRDLYAARFDRT